MSALIEAARADFERWAQPLLGDNPTWRESGPCELAWQAWNAALAAAEAQPVGEPFGYVITNNVPESSPYRHVFYRPSEISAAYKDNALYSTPVYTAPPEWPSAQPVGEPAPHAMQQLTAALQADPDYAWSWHCNLAMPVMDVTGVTHRVANEAGARLMRHLFDIDITKHPHYQVDTATPAQPAAQPLTDEWRQLYR